MKLTHQHKLWIVILAIVAGIALWVIRAKVAGGAATCSRKPVSCSGKWQTSHCWSDLRVGHNKNRRKSYRDA